MQSRQLRRYFHYLVQWNIGCSVYKSGNKRRAATFYLTRTPQELNKLYVYHKMCDLLFSTNSVTCSYEYSLRYAAHALRNILSTFI